MPYKNIVFVKLEKRLLNDYRWFGMSEKAQLLFIKLVLAAAETYNKLPTDWKLIRQLLHLDWKQKVIESALNEIQNSFPKFKKSENYYYFEDFHEKTNYIKDFQRISQRFPKEVADKEKEKEKEKEQDKDSKREEEISQTANPNDAPEERKVRSIFIAEWKFNIPTEHLLNLSVDLLKKYGEEKLRMGARICGEYGKRSNFRYLEGVLKGLVKAEEIAKIKDREQRAAEIKKQEEIFKPDPETAKIFRQLLEDMKRKNKTEYNPKEDISQKKRNEQFLQMVEKGEIQ